MKKNRIYISGAITGVKKYTERFAAAEKELTAAGWEVVNPAKVGEMLPPLSWAEYMDIAYPLLNLCGHIFILGDSENSAGVACEREFAEKCEIRIHEEKDGVPEATNND